MESIELICFNIIANAGAARSSFIEAISLVKKGDKQKALSLMSEGREALRQAHLIHADIIQKEANSEKVEIGVLLIHSEDIMMSAEVIELMANELIELHSYR